MIDPVRVPPGGEIVLDKDVTLARLAAGSEWAFLVRYSDFRSLLPSILKQESQMAMVAASDSTMLRVTLLKGAGPGTGAWPAVPLLEAAAPQVVLWPLDTTYPPDVADRLAALGAIRVPSDAVVEVITDGKQIWLRRWSGSRTGGWKPTG
jgi:hypothetical protein